MVRIIIVVVFIVIIIIIIIVIIIILIMVVVTIISSTSICIIVFSGSRMYSRPNRIRSNIWQSTLSCSCMPCHHRSQQQELVLRLSS